MMQDLHYLYKDREGNEIKVSLSFSVCEPVFRNVLPNTSIASIDIERISEISRISSKALFSIPGNILRLVENDTSIIFYYLCDTEPLNCIGRKHGCMSPQEYRNRLFDAIYHRFELSDMYVNRTIVLSDELHGALFVHIIYHRDTPEDDIKRLENEILNTSEEILTRK